MKVLNPGDIVLVKYPYAEGEADKLHPALVLEVQDFTVYLAYGTSQRVEQSARISTCVAIVDPADVEACHLHKATAFHLERRARVARRKVIARVGSIPTHKHMQLYKAAVAAGLLR